VFVLIIDRHLDSRDGTPHRYDRTGRRPMTMVVPLVLAVLLLVLLRRFILRRRRIRLRLPVSGPWHLPAWLRRRRR
jgi:hypothetical protein